MTLQQDSGAEGLEGKKKKQKNNTLEAAEKITMLLDRNW